MNRIIFLAALVSLASTEVPDAMLCGEVFLLMEETNELMNIEPSEDPDQHPLVDAILQKWGIDGCLHQVGFGEWWKEMNMVGDSSLVFNFINKEGSDLEVKWSAS